jgi:tRNA pseudouridine55 synthase
MACRIAASHSPLHDSPRLLLMFGILNIDKPAGMTSRAVVNGVQRLVRPHKAGHAGTLDPLATGVLVVCLGKATRLIEYVQQQRKRYVGEFEFGLTSDTEDVEGEVQRAAGAAEPSIDEIQSALPRFLGQILQRPPAYSALKVGGERAYKLARRGESVNLAPRKITIHSLTLVEYHYPRLVLDIVCGSGTYVRSLGRDIAESVNSCSVMTSLRRTAVGCFHIERSVPFSELNAENINAYLASPLMALESLPRITLSAAQQNELVHGRRIANQGLPPGSQAAGITHDGNLIAILEALDPHWLKPKRVFGS